MRPDAYGGDRTREEKSVECQQIFLCWTGRSRGAPASSTPGVISSTQNTTLVKNTCHLLLFFMIQQATDNIWVLNGEHCICISEDDHALHTPSTHTFLGIHKDTLYICLTIVYVSPLYMSHHCICPTTVYYSR